MYLARRRNLMESNINKEKFKDNQLIRENHIYKFTKVETSDIESFSKICNVDYLGENQWVEYFGSLIALFGEPLYISDDFETMFEYYIKAESKEGTYVVLSVYSGPSGPAIGGDVEIEWDKGRKAFQQEAVLALIELIKSTKPANYSYEGFYEDYSLGIKCGVKNGKPYYEEIEK